MAKTTKDICISARDAAEDKKLFGHGDVVGLVMNFQSLNYHFYVQSQTD
jgi:hypothetical protein